MKRRLLIVAVFLLAGAVVNVAVAWGIAVAIDITPASTRTGWSNTPPVFWQVTRVDRFGTTWMMSSKQESHELYLLQGMSDPPPPKIPYYWASHTGAWRAREGEVETRYLEARGWPSRTLWCNAGGWLMRGGPKGTLVPRPVDGGIDTSLETSRMIYGGNYDRALPLRPIWPGFAVNTLFYAVVLWLLIPGPFVLRRLIRIRRGLCPKCTYPMGESAVCSECGCELPNRARVAT